MLRPLIVRGTIEPPVEIPAWSKRTRDLIHRTRRIHQVLAYVHRGDQVGRLLGHRLLFQIDEMRRNAALFKPPATEPQQGRADIGRSNIEGVTRKEDSARTDSGPEIQIPPASVLPGKVKDGDISKRRFVLDERVPPDEVV